VSSQPLLDAVTSAMLSRWVQVSAIVVVFMLSFESLAIPLRVRLGGVVGALEELEQHGVRVGAVRTSS
jgi:hypothetical protein